MKRWIAMIALTLTVTVGLVATTPPGAAQATACISSVTCNPANVAMLTEAGIITTEAGTTIVAPAAVGSAAVAGVNWSGVWSSVAGAFIGGTSLLGAAYMGSNGWFGQELLPDPGYTPTPNFDPCGVTPTGPTTGNVSTTWVQPDCNVIYGRNWNAATGTSSSVTGAAYVISDYTINPPTSSSAKSVTFDYEYKPGWAGSWPSSPYTVLNPPQITIRCYTTAGSYISGSPTNPSFSSTMTSGTMTMQCPGGGGTTNDYHIVLWGQTFTGTPPNTFGYGHLYDSVYGGKAVPSDAIDGEVRSTVTCKKADLTTYNVYKVESFIVVGDDPIPVPDARCATGELAIAGTVEWRPTGTTEWLDLIEADVPPAVGTLMDEYPECYVAEVNPCTITLWKVNAQGGLETCGAIGQFCPDWATTDPDVLTSRYKCKYGSHDADIGMCSAYRSPTTGVQANVDENGDWLSPTAPVATPNPKTDEELAELGVDLSEVIDTEGTGDCWPSGWGVLNPLSWVYMPVRCVFEWAFVPSQDSMTLAQEELQTALDESILGDAETLVDAVVVPFQIGSTGCQGPPFRVEIQGLPGIGMDQTYYPLSACSGPMVGVAGFFRILSQGFVAVGAGLAGLRYFASIAGFIGPGSSGSASSSSVRFKESA